jgi:carboxyl-terminal processing protease
VGRYYTVSGKSTQIDGVKADVIVPTIYSAYQIGERYLDYPLSSDHVPPAFMDPLTDLKDGSKRWFTKYYLPTIQKRIDIWRQLIPNLKRNSEKRIASNVDYQVFLSFLETSNARGNWGEEDLQMEEAVQIVRDMAYIHR